MKTLFMTNFFKKKGYSVFKKTVLLLSAALLLPACALVPSQSGDSYNRNEARQLQTVLDGTIVSIRAVKIDGTRSGTGALTGAAVGGVAGGAIGRGYGSLASAVAGAVAGGLLGSAAEQGITSKEGLEITVRLARGDTVSVVQEAGNDKFRAGDRVRVMYSANGSARVTPAY